MSPPPVPQNTSLPYGIRNIMLTPYADVAGTTLGDTVIKLPNAQTLSFSEAEDYDTLRGDDAVVTVHGQGATVDWELDSGGISLDAWAAVSGGTVTETGTTPARKTTMSKKSKTIRPWILIEGQAISDSGGDIHVVIWRAKCNDALEGDFEDAKFTTPSAKGIGLPLADTDNLYEFIQNEAVTPIDADTPLTLPVS